MEAPYNGVIKKVRVMLVDNDNEFVTKMVDLLKSYDYKVTTVGTFSSAMSMLSKGKKKIDVIIIHSHSSNMLSWDLLAKAVSLDIISLFVCDEHDELVAKKALNEGAYLYLINPFDEVILKYLWQFVLWKKIQRQKVMEGSKVNRNQIMNVVDISNKNILGDNEEQYEEKKNMSSTEEHKNNIHEAENDVGANEKYKQTMKRSRKNMNEIDERERKSSGINKVVWRNVCTVWTDDLHAKFMEVVQQIGEKKCQPKGICEVMNVLDIFRKQVASHLQKYRRDNRKTPKEQKSTCHPSGQGSSRSSEQRSSFQEFGAMPFLQENVPNLQHKSKQPQRGSEFSFSTLNTNDSVFGGESSIQQLYRPKLQAQPHYLNIDNSFNNTFLSTQNNDDGGLQQQHGSLFGLLDSQGLQGQIIGNTNVDVDAHNVTTYLGSGMIPATYLENTLGATNANSQQNINKQNMSDPINIVMASYESDVEGSDSNEKEDCDAYFYFNNIDYLSQNLESPTSHPPNE